MAPPWHSSKGLNEGRNRTLPQFAASCRFCFGPQVPICCARTIRARLPDRFNAVRSSLSSGYDPFVQARVWVTIKPKYVNMADINISRLSDRPASAQTDQGPHSAEPIWDLIELLF